MQLAKQNRNQFVDIMRGIAMLLVVLGHTITGCTIGSQKTFLFNVIWSLQMPLFILISGYVTKYSHEIKDISSLWLYIKRRTIAYVLPWIVWSFIVRGIVFKQSDFFNIKYIFWHMDAGYWFLATIWTISMIFGISSFVSSRFIESSALMKQGILLATYLACMALLGIIAILEGLSFFAIKLTLYYLPFYYIGYLYGQYNDKLLCNERNKKISDGIIAVAFIIWIFVIVNYSLYGMSDRGIDVLIRAITSLSGCIAVCGLCYGIFSEKNWGGTGHGRSTFFRNISDTLPSAEYNKIYTQNSTDEPSRNFNSNCKLCDNCLLGGVPDKTDRKEQTFNIFTIWEKSLNDLLIWAGKRSLEIYMLHGLLLNIFKSNTEVGFNSIEGYVLSFANFIFTVLLCAIVISLLSKNFLLKKFLSIR